MSVELEQKYVVDTEEPWTVQATLLALLSGAGYSAVLSGERPQSDTYYDTHDDALLRGGGSLRVRQRGGRQVLTVKTLLAVGAGTFARREDELELCHGADPEEFLHRLLPELDFAGLRPTAQVDNLRQTYEVQAPSGAKFELAFDDVTFRDPQTGRETGERQVEIERLTGGEEDLRRLVRESAGKMAALRPSTESKYQRARALTK